MWQKTETSITHGKTHTHRHDCRKTWLFQMAVSICVTLHDPGGLRIMLSAETLLWADCSGCGLHYHCLLACHSVQLVSVADHSSLPNRSLICMSPDRTHQMTTAERVSATRKVWKHPHVDWALTPVKSSIQCWDSRPTKESNHTTLAITPWMFWPGNDRTCR